MYVTQWRQMDRLEKRSENKFIFCDFKPDTGNKH